MGIISKDGSATVASSPLSFNLSGKYSGERCEGKCEGGKEATIYSQHDNQYGTRKKPKRGVVKVSDKGDPPGL